VPTCPQWRLRDLVEPQSLPDEAALDGVDEFLSTGYAGPYSWPHESATVDYQATEGTSWRLSLAADGVQVIGLPVLTPTAGRRQAASASVRGTASQLVLALYERIPVDSLPVEGDRRLFGGPGSLSCSGPVR
jgi:hypothetical protein